MARPRPELFDKKKIVAENRRARFEYFLEDVFEAGIALQGTEVKSLIIMSPSGPASCCCTSGRSPACMARWSARG